MQFTALKYSALGTELAQTFSRSLRNNELGGEKMYLELLPVFCPLAFSSVTTALVVWPK